MIKFLKKSKKLELVSPMKGKVVKLESVPDDVFANKYIGDGVAIIPVENKIYAPCDGKVIQIFPTNHAIGIETSLGIDVLLHIGIDTVELGGKGFNRFVEEGDKIKKGDLILEVDFNQVKASGKPIISPLIIVNMEEVEIGQRSFGDVDANRQVILEATRK